MHDGFMFLAFAVVTLAVGVILLLRMVNDLEQRIEKLEGNR